MTVRNLDAFFAPRSVALLGASEKPGSVGHVVARNLLAAGFVGPLFFVNPKGGSIEGRAVHPAIAALPETPDLGVVAVPPAAVPGAIAELAARGSRAAVVITAGFAELGEAGATLQAKMLAATRSSGLRIVGPNCLGVMAPGAGLDASFAHIAPLKGDLAFVAQSGAVITSVIDWAVARGIGFSHVVSIGGMADVDFGDLLDFFAGNTQVRGVLLYVEEITAARKFMSAARRVARLKPVVAVKAGRFEEGARAAASHTGALAGSDEVYDAAFRRAGMLRVNGLGELFEAVETLARGLAVDGPRLAILSNGGGIGVLATDTLIEEGGVLARLGGDTIAALDKVLPRTWSRANPVDIIGDADGARYAAALGALLGDRGIDAVLAMNCPTAIADSADAARAVVAAYAAHGPPKPPLLAAWLGEARGRDARNVFENARVPVFATPDEAVRAFGHLARHKRNQDMLVEAPSGDPIVPGAARAKAQAIVARANSQSRAMLSEPEAKAILKAYGIPVVETVTAKTPDEAAKAAARLGFPAALKILSPDISHKTDVGGVALGLADAAAVLAEADAMLARVAKRAPQAKLEGFAVQPMASRPGAHELIVGLSEDRVFGPVVLFGHGGTAVEVVRDKAMALPPLNSVLAREMVERTRIARLLMGYRDRPAADMDAIVRTILAIAELAADIPEIAELDINPLWADRAGVLALDARMRLGEGRADRFAIRPYPKELMREIVDRAGRAYKMRPIRPEDAERVQAMVAACAPEDIRMRFFTALTRLPEKLALRLTQIDYDREMAFVVEEGARGPFAGIVRLACDPDFARGEYAVIVRSDLKGTGLGYRMMQEIVAFARARGLKEIFGDILAENARMRAMAKELGFVERPLSEEPGTVEAVLTL